MSEFIKKIPLKAEQQDAYLRYLTMKDLPAILKLQTVVYKALEDKKRLQPLEVEEFETILEGEPLTVGIFHQDELIAFRAFFNPVQDEEGLGGDIGLTEKDYPEILYSEITNVHPNYRGNHLQIKMGKFIMETLDTSAFRYILATVAPGNIPSMKDKFALGMRIYTVKEKYEGKLRYVYCKDLQLKEMPRREQIEVRLEDIDGQVELLENDYIGIGMKREENQWIMIYQ